MNLLNAIAREEGWEIPTSRCRKNLNPGNIEWGKFASAHGSTGPETVYSGVTRTPTVGRFAVFPTAEVGFGCLNALLRSPGYSGLTIAEAIAKYAPGTENDTQKYISNVCAWLNCPESDLISAHLPLTGQKS